jgi:carbamoyl-phosphate synthase large subunit
VLDLPGKIITTDAGSIAPTAFLSDQHFHVPPVTDPKYVDSLLSVCRVARIDVLVPTIDTELPFFAAMRSMFKEAGVSLIVSDEETIEIAADKRYTHRWLLKEGFPCPKQWDLSEERPGREDYPVITKPAQGSMSDGVQIVRDPAELATAVSERPETVLVAESIAGGVEYTVSTYVDRYGANIASIPRRRLEVRAGEVSKALAERNAEVEQLATDVVHSLPGARGPLNVQIMYDRNSRRSQIIEINARLGGGDPLAWRAGVDVPRWILEEHLDMPISYPQPWTDGLAMLRFDDAVFVPLEHHCE